MDLKVLLERQDHLVAREIEVNKESKEDEDLKGKL